MRPEDPDAEQTVRAVPVPEPSLKPAPILPARNYKGTVLTSVLVQYDPDALVWVVRRTRTPDNLRTLRKELRDTHFVHADGKSILIVARHAGVPPVTGPGAHHRLSDIPGLLCAIIRDRCIDVMVEGGRARVIQHYPLRVISGREQDDLIPKALGRLSRPVPDGLSHNREFVLEVHCLRQPSGPPVLALSIGLKTAVRIDAPVSALVAEGVNVSGLYVANERDGSDDRLEPIRRLIGCVVEVADGIVHLDDVRPNTDSTVPADEAFVEPKLENIETILKTTHGHAAHNLGERLRTAAGSVLSGHARLNFAEQLLTHFREQATVVETGVERWSIAKGIDITFDRSLRHSALDSLLPPRDLSPPTVKFDPRNPRMISSYLDAAKGLDKWGPYDGQVSREPMVIAAIYERRLEKPVSKAVLEFLHGMDDTSYFQKGFLGRFGLKMLGNVRTYPVDDSTVESYQRACVQALNDAQEEGQKLGLVLVQLRDESKERPEPQNPYIATQAAFRQEGVAVQHFRIETIQTRRSQLAFSLSNMSLAVYAKLGGMAFVPAVQPSEAHELIIGLRSQVVRDSRLGPGKHVLGVAAIFSGDAQFQLADQTRAVLAKDYSSAIQNVVKTAIRAVQRKMGWDRDDPIHLTFHSFRPPKQTDIEDVEALVQSLGFTNVKFAFLHLVEHHASVMIDTTARGAKCGNGPRKGVLAPPRGRYVPLDTHQGLLVVRGPEQLKRSTDGLPKPLKARLDPSSTLTDMDRLMQQLYVLACSSQRTFRDPIPITISYPELIAEATIKYAKFMRKPIDAIFLRQNEQLSFL